MPLKSIVLLLVMSLIPSASPSDGILYQTLSKDVQGFLRGEVEGYTSLIRPRWQPSESVVVTVNIDITTLLNVNEREKSVQAMVWFQVSWHDEVFEAFFKRSPSAPSAFVLPGSKIWTPDIYVFGDQAESYIDMNSLPVMVSNDGQVYTTVGGLRVIKCRFRMTYFPFDKHLCQIGIGGFVSSDNETRFDDGGWNDNGELPWHVEHAEWRQSTITVATANNQVVYSFSLQRKPLRSLFAVVLPGILYFALIVASFWVPPETGERLSFTATLFLAFAVLALFLDGSMPQDAEHIPLFAIFVFVATLLSSLSIIIAIALLRLQSGTKVAAWLKRLLKPLCRSCRSKTGAASPVDAKGESEKGETGDDESRAVAARLDKLCFTLTVTVGVLLIIVFSALSLHCYITDSCAVAP